MKLFLQCGPDGRCEVWEDKHVGEVNIGVLASISGLTHVLVVHRFVSLGDCDSRATEDVNEYFANSATELDAAYRHNEVSAIDVWHYGRIIEDALQRDLHITFMLEPFLGVDILHEELRRLAT